MYRVFRVATVFALIATGTMARAQDGQCPQTGPTSPDGLATEWILVGWEKKLGDGPLNFRSKLGRFYDWQSGGVVKSYYDDLAPGRRTAREPGEYGAMWEGPFTAMKSASHRLSTKPTTLHGAGLAQTNLEFVAKLVGPNDKLTGIRTHVSLVWHCVEQGWRIVREHNSSTVLEEREIEPAWAAASAQ